MSRMQDRSDGAHECLPAGNSEGIGLNPVLLAFLAKQVGGFAMLGVIYLLRVQSDESHPLRSFLLLWAAYALIFSAVFAAGSFRLAGPFRLRCR